MTNWVIVDGDAAGCSEVDASRREQGAGSQASMKVIELGANWFPEVQGGGLDRFYWELLSHLPDVGIDARGLVAGSAEVEGATGGLVRGFAPWASPLPRRLWSARGAVAQMIADFRPDLVASHFALYTLPALERIAGRPLVVHFHGPWADESGAEGQGGLAQWGKALIERAVYRRGHTVIVLSRAFGGVLRDRYGVAEECIRVVPGGVEAARFELGCCRAEARGRLDWPRDQPIVLSVRRLMRRMGLEDLIEAAADLRRRVPDALVVIAGRGPLEPELRRRAAERDLDGYVRFVGFVTEENLPLAYRAADVSVVPTVALEGFGLITIESLAAGTPVLVTPVGGLPEVVRGLSPELILPEVGPRALAEGIANALTGALVMPGEAACRTYVREHFDWPVIARRIRAVYDEALA
jgi:glycogen synthase